MVTKEKVAWCKRASNALKRALGDDLEAIKQEVISGSCELWRYSDGGYCVTRLEVSAQQKELVIVASGVTKGSEKLASRENWAMRIHSKRAGMSKFVEQHGFETLETVYRRVENGR